MNPQMKKILDLDSVDNALVIAGADKNYEPGRALEKCVNLLGLYRMDPLVRL